ncbi:pseudouridine synthase [Paraburkholderia dinghuensis]|uniref:Dual-specificity RNA pseudouridine synthase RluF n=2 Tax=Paraburkholderia dinghuensis TaxID=2305225 RepID=A0A3N6MVR4_9BURK|nr:pseudouridine synthase [Paraburkholderia dinghuensis]
MSTRARLTAKHPRPTTSERAPVRPGSTTARKPVRKAASPAPEAKTSTKPALARGENRATERAGARSGVSRERDTTSRPARTSGSAYGKPADGTARGGKAGGFGGKPAGARAPRTGDGHTGEHRRPGAARDADAPRATRSWDRDERPARRGDGDERRPARARSEGFGDERRPARPRSENSGDERRPARTRSEGFGDERRPARARSEGFGDERRPPRARSEGFGDERRPARPRSEGFGDERRPARPRSEGFGDERRPARARSESVGDERRPARPHSGSYSDERRPTRARSDGFSSERRPARPRAEGSDEGKRTFGERKAPGSAPRREYGTAENRRPRDEGTRRTSSERPAREERSFARPAKAAPRDGNDTPARRRDTANREGAGPRARRSFDDAPVRKIATRVKQDEHAGRRPPVESTEAAAPRRTPHTGADATGSLRLSKRMSELGLCSRREADEWIEKGWVLVDGERIDTLGAKVTPDQQIEIDPAARAAQARQVTILLHKPVGYVSGQAEDGYPPAATLVTAGNQWDGDRSGIRFSPLHLRTLAPAGRLDIDSTGLLVLTQDGRVAKQLIGEQSDIDKEYLVRVTYNELESDIDQQFPAELLAKLRHGLSLDDVPLKPAMVSWQNGEQLRFVLREGKKRQIRRMCELVGLKVVGLKRVRMGRVLLGALPQGQWRYLTPDESF